MDTEWTQIVLQIKKKKKKNSFYYSQTQQIECTEMNGNPLSHHKLSHVIFTLLLSVLYLWDTWVTPDEPWS